MATRLTVTLYPSDDNLFQTDSPNFNHGPSTEIAAGEEDFTNTIYRLAIRFSFATMPVSTVITAASLKMYCFGDASNGTGRAKLHRNTSSWSENTVTWNTQPSNDASVVSYSDIANGYTGDVTWTGLASIVQAWINGTYNNYGMKMRITSTSSESEDDKHFKFRSKEYVTQGQRPRLILEYYYSPDIITSNPSNIINVGARLNGNIVSVNGDDVTERGFQIGKTQTADIVVNESGTFASGSFSLSVNNLESSTFYWVRAYATNAAGTSYGSWVQFRVADGALLMI